MHAGKENMFVFGVDANDIGRLREERKNFKVDDPRWEKVLSFLTSNTFEKGLFQVRACPALRDLIADVFMLDMMLEQV